MADEKQRWELWGVVRRAGRDFWTRIGAGFENQDGSWNLLFDYFPISPSSTVQMRKPKPAQEEE